MDAYSLRQDSRQCVVRGCFSAGVVIPASSKKHPPAVLDSEPRTELTPVRPGVQTTMRTVAPTDINITDAAFICSNPDSSRYQQLK
ncbi:hypothetical protein BaRGS_00003947 [Batillaria attramentaria]|uniref:Uncharacterized protein n=1 Tax=Batillaria attramentaria TaxID=370345 RepID=A0ABD0LYX5_9CAEN